MTRLNLLIIWFRRHNLNREIERFRGKIRLDTTSHSIPHTRKWLKMVKKLNGQTSYSGSIFCSDFHQSNVVMNWYFTAIQNTTPNRPGIDLKRTILFYSLVSNRQKQVAWWGQVLKGKWKKLCFLSYDRNSAPFKTSSNRSTIRHSQKVKRLNIS